MSTPTETVSTSQLNSDLATSDLATSDGRAAWMGLALLAHTGWGMYPVIGRYMQTVSGLPTLSLLVVGGIPMLVAMIVYVLPRTGWRVFASRIMWALALSVVIRSVTNLLAARYTLAIYVQLITLMTPFVVVLISRAVLHEPIPRFTLPALTLSTLGALLMLSSNPSGAGLQFSLTQSDWLGVALTVISSVALAFYMIVIRRTAEQRDDREQVSSAAVLVFQSVVIMAVSLPASLLVGEDWGQWLRLGPRDWLVVAAFIVVVILGANGLQILALRKLGAPFVSSLLAWRLVSTLIVAWLLLGERLTSAWQVVGAVVVLITVSWYLWKQQQGTPRGV